MMVLWATSLAFGVVASFVLRVYAFAIALFLVLVAGAIGRLVFGFHGLTSIWDGTALLLASNAGYAVGISLQVAARFFFKNADVPMSRSGEASNRGPGAALR